MRACGAPLGTQCGLSRQPLACHGRLSQGRALALGVNRQPRRLLLRTITLCQRTEEAQRQGCRPLEESGGQAARQLSRPCTQGGVPGTSRPPPTASNAIAPFSHRREQEQQGAALSSTAAAVEECPQGEGEAGNQLATNSSSSLAARVLLPGARYGALHRPVGLMAASASVLSAAVQLSGKSAC